MPVFKNEKAYINCKRAAEQTRQKQSSVRFFKIIGSVCFVFEIFYKQKSIKIDCKQICADESIKNSHNASISVFSLFQTPSLRCCVGIALFRFCSGNMRRRYRGGINFLCDKGGKHTLPVDAVDFFIGKSYNTDIDGGGLLMFFRGVLQLLKKVLKITEKRRTNRSIIENSLDSPRRFVVYF